MVNYQERYHRGYGNLFRPVGHCLVRITGVYKFVTIIHGLVNLRFEGDLVGLLFLSSICAGELLHFQFLLEVDLGFPSLDYFSLIKYSHLNCVDYLFGFFDFLFRAFKFFLHIKLVNWGEL